MWREKSLEFHGLRLYDTDLVMSACACRTRLESLEVFAFAQLDITAQYTGGL